MTTFGFYNSELDLVIKFRILSIEQSQDFVVRYGEESKANYIYDVVSACIANIDSEIRPAMVRLAPLQADYTLLTLYNACVMLNPILDVDTWAEISRSYNLFHQDMTTKPDIFPPAIISGVETSHEVGDSQTKNPKKEAKPLIIGKQVLNSLPKVLKSKVIGQDYPIDLVFRALRRHQVGLTDAETPIGVYMFAGPSGVGKTLVAEVLNDHLYGPDRPLVRIDCGEFQHKHENSRLLGCFVKDSQVLLYDGVTKAIQNVEIGDEVITHKGRKRKVEQIHKYDNVDPLIEIAFSCAEQSITCTPSHEFFAVKGGKNELINQSYSIRTINRKLAKRTRTDNLEWIPAEKLEIGDWVCVPRTSLQTSTAYFVYDLKDFIRNQGKATFNRYKITDNEIYAYDNNRFNRYIQLNEELAALLGYYTSEGHVLSKEKGIAFTFHEKETHYVNHVIDLMSKVFNINSFRLTPKSGKAVRLEFISRIVGFFFERLCGRGSANKRLPAELIENSSREVIVSAINTMFLGDGCLTIKNRIDLSTSSDNLASQTKFLLEKLGYEYYCSGENPGETNNYTTRRHRLYLSVQGAHHFMYEALYFKEDFLDINPSIRSVRNMRSDENYIYMKVNGIKTVESQPYVYDLTIEEDSSYTVDHIAVHNSPPGYIGHDEGGLFARMLKKSNGSIVLLDEAEKAHPDFWDTMLRLFDKGTIIDAKNNFLDFRNSIFILTSNLGNEKISAAAYGNQPGFGVGAVGSKYDSKIVPKRELVERLTTEAIRDYFKPELINRIDETIIFNHLTEANYLKIAELEFLGIRNKMMMKEFNLDWTEAALKLLVDQSSKAMEGARGMSKIRRTMVEDKIAELLYTGKHPKWKTFEVDAEENRFKID